MKAIKFKPVINKRNGQIALHPKKSELPRRLLEKIYKREEFEMKLEDYWDD